MTKELNHTVRSVRFWPEISCDARIDEQDLELGFFTGAGVPCLGAGDRCPELDIVDKLVEV